jgi:predicted transcriptional regulator
MEATEELTPDVTPETKTKLSREERSKIAKEAATRRWTKERRAKKAVKGKPAKGKKSAGPREFTSALKMAEKRLTKAIQERAEHAAKYAVLSAEIPSLQRLIVALRNPLGVAPEYGVPVAPSLEQIVGDQPLPYGLTSYQNPPLRPVPAAVPVLPPTAHPVTSQGRAMGGAVGVELVEDEDENKFLNDSALGGATGEWH